MKPLKKVFSVVMALALSVTIAPARSSVKAVSAPGNIELSRKIAGEGMVLLENHGALPLPKGTVRCSVRIRAD